MATLTPGASLGVDLYVRRRANDQATLLFREDQTVDWATLETLQEGSDEFKVFVDRKHQQRYQQYLRDQWRDLTSDSSSPISTRLNVISEVVRDVMSEQFKGAEAKNTEKLIEVTMDLAENAVKVINSQNIVLDELFDVLRHDYGTFTHSTNVSMYAVLLAKELGFSIQDQTDIAAGGLLHDIGKIDIDAHILNKPGKLDLEELAIIRRHPQLGFEKLAPQPDLNIGILMMTYQHHERIDGSGYPCSVPDLEIHPWAKLCAIVDVFEAITSDRPYLVPCSVESALNLMESGRDKQFDGDMLDVWVRLQKSSGGNHA
jgi:putative nucleotidyltransferase with HDIG domain